MSRQPWMADFHFFRGREGYYYGRQPVDFGGADLEIVYGQSALRNDGTIAGEVTELVRRQMPLELRTARSMLLRVRDDNHSEVADWLSSVRCFRLRPQSTNNNRVSFQEADVEEWTSSNVTSEVISMVNNHRNLHAWLMSLSREQFHHQLQKWREYIRKRKVDLQSGADRELKSRLAEKAKVPNFVNIDFLFRFISDVAQCTELATGFGKGFEALIQFDVQSGPFLSVTAPEVFAGMNLLTFNDQTFLRRPILVCECCGLSFVAPHRDNKYCSPRCRDYEVTVRRRAKLRLIKQGLTAWLSLNRKDTQPDDDDQATWITEWVLCNWPDAFGEKPQLKPDWVKAQLKKTGGD